MNYNQENIYGSLNKLNWIKKFINHNKTIIDLGCGTGVTITIPLIRENYNIIGIDLDKKSIEYGKQLLRAENLNENLMQCKNLAEVAKSVDVIILSEVLEHLSSDNLNNLLELIFKKLNPGGLLLLTVPNGYGCFEFESFLWYRLKLGRFLEKIYLVEGIIIIKNKLFGNTIDPHPSSLDSSGHIQRFTYKSIQKCIGIRFTVKESCGGSLISGPFSNLFFTGILPLMKLNLVLGKKLPHLASGFYLAAQKTK